MGNRGHSPELVVARVPIVTCVLIVAHVLVIACVLVVAHVLIVTRVLVVACVCSCVLAVIRGPWWFARFVVCGPW